MNLPYSLEIESTFLASIIKYPKVIPDYLEFLSDDLFYGEIHKTIAGAIRSQFNQKKTVDPVILADYICNIGLRNQDELDVPDYIKSISARKAVTPDNILVYFKDCVKYKIARLGIENCEKTIRHIRGAISGSTKDVCEALEKGMTRVATVDIEDDYDLIDIYKDMPQFLEEIGERGGKDGILTPFKTWNRWWGPLTVGDLVIIAAPPKTGKSTILNYLADVPFCKFNAGKTIKVLFLDTELETERVRTRKAAAMSDVKEIFIKNGQWQKNEETVEKVTAQFPRMEKRVGSFKHKYVANLEIDQICKIVRRWAATECEEGDLKLVIYDYMKITGEKISNFDQEWQVLGRKCDTLKHLLSEIGAAGIAAVQTNSANDVAASQRIKWFASMVLFFTKKTPQELAEHGEEFGTHTLHPFVLRNQGEFWDEEMLVKEQCKSGVMYHTNQIHIQVKNFDMKECGTLADVIKKKGEQIDIDKPEPLEGEGGRRRPKPISLEEELL